MARIATEDSVVRTYRPLRSALGRLGFAHLFGSSMPRSSHVTLNRADERVGTVSLLDVPLLGLQSVQGRLLERHGGILVLRLQAITLSRMGRRG